MKQVFRKLAGLLLIWPFLVAANAAMAEEKTPSGTITIDETQVMWIVGGDIGGGTLEFHDQSYEFRIDGLKLGGFGVHKVKLTGEVYDLDDVADFAGVYAAAEAGFTVGDAGKGDFWLKNDKGVKLRLKSPASEGIALDLGVEGLDIRMK
jgi:hypothetical protein